MSTAILPFAAPPTVREVIEASLRLFARSVLPCLPLATIGALLAQLAYAHEVATLGPGRALDTSPMLASKDTTWWLLYAIGTLASLIVWTIVLRRQQSLAYAPGAPPAGANFGPERYPAVLLFFVLSMIIAFIAALPSLLIVAFVPMSKAMQVLVVALPMFAASAAVSLGWPALVFEGKAATESVGEGLRLAVRHASRLLRVAVAIVGTLIVILVLAGFVLGILGALASTAGPMVQTAVMVCVLFAIVGLVMLYLLAFLLIVFADLRAHSSPSSSLAA